MVSCLRSEGGMEATLVFPSDAPPLSLLATAAVAGFSFSTLADLPSGSRPLLSFPSSGIELQGTNTILRYIGRVSTIEGFYGADPLSAALVDEWIDYASTFSNGSEFEESCGYTNTYLEPRTFLVGFSISIADIVIWTNLAASGQRWESLRKGVKFPNLVRWYNSILFQYPALEDLTSRYVRRKGKPMPIIKPNLMDARQVDRNQLKTDKEKAEGSFDIDLPGAEMGKVCTRFPPEPSGYLHIGHAKAALLNQYFAEKYQGRLIIRFDDTNPAKEKEEFVQNILNDLEYLGVKGDLVTYTSDYFPELMEMAEKLIKEGKAYIDDTPREQMQKERMDGIESSHRNQSVPENLSLWKEMIEATERDSREGVTHALRSSEYHDRNDQYYKILEDMGLRKVHVWDFSRLNLVYTLLSKRKLQWFVDTGRVDGWDDPRFPTVQGIRRRGLTVEALKQFILSQGASKNLNLMEWDKLWTINKKIIDPVCPRHTAVFSDGKVLLFLKNGPDTPFVRVIPRHKKFEGAGKKATTFTKKIWLDKADALSISEGEEVTLMDWGNAIIEKVEKDEKGVTFLTGFLHLEGSVKTTKLKLTWLPETEELVNLSLVELDLLITKKKLEENDDLVSFLNPVTRLEIPAVGDSNMRNLKRGEIVQLERKGYFICDSPFIRSSKPITLILIPDGRRSPPPGELSKA
ncbi:hypothetical protein O6H91_Y004100 [Diphasiastrum complanatum]|nr:hypothetical protein O6H91_Y004100 [Diphasiastrum complanatum]